MLKINFLFILLLLACFPLSTTAQKYEFTHYYADDGLSQSTISSIEQDYQDFMWFGTFNGLNRFDGYSFKVYKNDPQDPKSLSSSHIETILEDSKKNLWIGTADGVNFYDRQKDAFDYYRYADPSPHEYAVNAFAEGKNGRIWVGGGQGLCYIDSITKTVINTQPTNEETERVIFDIVVEASGNLWLATNQGLFYYDVINNLTKNVPTENSFPTNGQPNEAKSLMIDSGGALWVGCQNGIYKLRNGANNPELQLPALKKKLISDIAQAKDGTLLIATESGLHVYDERTGILQHYIKEREGNSISDNVVKQIFHDRLNHLWLATFYGLNYYGGNPNFDYFGKATIEKRGLKNPYVTTLSSNGTGTVFVGTAEGVEIIEPESGKIVTDASRYSELSSLKNSIVSLASDNKENVFITAWPRGIYIYNWRKNILKQLQYDDKSCKLPVLVYDNEQLWVGCENNLYQYDLKADRFSKHNVLEDCNIMYIKQDSRRNLLLGGASGIVKFNPFTSGIMHYKNVSGIADGLHARVINCIYEDEEKNFWIATDQGLFLLNKNYELTSFWNKNGFGDDDVKSITEDRHDNLWISTTNRLYRFNRKTYALRKFEFTDGLFAKEFSNDAAVALQSGHMVFGGKQGLVVFHPDSIGANPIPPNVVLTDFKILNKAVAIGSGMLPTHISVARKLALDHTATEFSFEFVALNFSSTRKNQYAYMMEGFDKAWNYSGARRFASYTNLPGGREYTFRVKASNEDNVWNEQGTSLKIYIHPPFWKTWWFKAALYVLIVTSAYTVYRIRVNSLRKHRIQLRKQKMLLEQEVRERTAELVEANEKLKEQAEKIAHMNVLLQEDNVKLEHDLKDLVTARIMQKRVSFDEFCKLYPDNDACYRLIDELKSSKDFCCKKCHYHKYSKGVDHSRRCSRCNYVETIITGTIFAGIKFPITKAFYLLFLMSDGRHYTIGDLSELVDLRQQTCWTFKKRVEERTRNFNIQKNKDGWIQVIMLPDLAHEKY